jgi:hypothetical protein
MLSRIIKVGTITLTLGTNNGFHRYEGFSENSRVLVRQDPWGTWSACVVKCNGRGTIISVYGDYSTPEEAGQALLEDIVLFHKGLSEIIGVHEMPKV